MIWHTITFFILFFLSISVLNLTLFQELVTWRLRTLRTTKYDKLAVLLVFSAILYDNSRHGYSLQNR